MNIIFNQRVKHGTFDFIPNAVVYGVSAIAGAYFTNAGWADEAPAGAVADITYGDEEIAIDPETRFANGPNAGQLIIHDGVLGNSN